MASKEDNLGVKFLEAAHQLLNAALVIGAGKGLVPWADGYIQVTFRDIDAHEDVGCGHKEPEPPVLVSAGFSPLRLFGMKQAGVVDRPRYGPGPRAGTICHTAAQEDCPRACPWELPNPETRFLGANYVH